MHPLHRHSPVNRHICVFRFTFGPYVHQLRAECPRRRFRRRVSLRLDLVSLCLARMSHLCGRACTCCSWWSLWSPVVRCPLSMTGSSYLRSLSHEFLRQHFHLEVDLHSIPPGWPRLLPFLISPDIVLLRSGSSIFHSLCCTESASTAERGLCRPCPAQC
jgi:hypothetical protein